MKKALLLFITGEQASGAHLQSSWNGRQTQDGKELLELMAEKKTMSDRNQET